MKVKNVKTNMFYPTMKAWWEGHNFPVLDRNFLPEEVFVCYNGHIAIYSICFYHTDSGLCWIGFPVSNPDVDKETKEGGFSNLLEAVSEYAKQCGYNFMFTTSPIKHVQDILVSSDFNLGDENVNHYLKIL